MKVEPTRIEKPWGHELIWARTDRYVGKILHIRKNEALSFQYHRRKEETIRVLAGRMQLETATEEGEGHQRFSSPATRCTFLRGFATE